MATDKKQVEIPGRLHSVATEGVVAGANEILDDNKGKSQQEINASVDDSLQENKTNIANEITRATNAENAIKGGSSKSIQNLDSRLSTVEAHDTISMDGGSVIVGTAEDFTNRTTAGDAKIPTVGAILNAADEEPTAGSDNLVKSRGVAKESDKIHQIINGINNTTNYTYEKSSFIKESETPFSLIDKDGNVGMLVDSEGNIDAIDFGENLKNRISDIASKKTQSNLIHETEEEGFYISDSLGNIGLSLKNGELDAIGVGSNIKTALSGVSDYKESISINKVYSELKRLKDITEQSVKSLQLIRSNDSTFLKTFSIPASNTKREHVILRVGVHKGNNLSGRGSIFNEVFFNGNCNNDFSDIRFFDGSKMLNVRKLHSGNYEVFRDKNFEPGCRICSDANGYIYNVRNQVLYRSKDGGISFSPINNPISNISNIMGVDSRNYLYLNVRDTNPSHTATYDKSPYIFMLDLNQSFDQNDFVLVCDMTFAGWQDTEEKVAADSVLQASTAGIVELDGYIFFGRYQSAYNPIIYRSINSNMSQESGQYTKIVYDQIDFTIRNQHIHNLYVSKSTKQVWAGIDDSTHGVRCMFSDDYGETWVTWNDFIESDAWNAQYGRDYIPSYVSSDGTWMIGGGEVAILGGCTTCKIFNEVDEGECARPSRMERKVLTAQGSRFASAFSDDFVVTGLNAGHGSTADAHVLLITENGEKYETIYSQMATGPNVAAGAGVRYFSKPFIPNTESEPVIYVDGIGDQVDTLRIVRGGNHYYGEMLVDIGDIEAGETKTITVQSGYIMSQPNIQILQREHIKPVYSIPLDEGNGSMIGDSNGNTHTIRGKYKWESIDNGICFGSYWPLQKPYDKHNGLRLYPDAYIDLGIIPQLSFSKGFTITLWAAFDDVLSNYKELRYNCKQVLLSNNEISLLKTRYYSIGLGNTSNNIRVDKAVSPFCWHIWLPITIIVSNDNRPTITAAVGEDVFEVSDPASSDWTFSNLSELPLRIGCQNYDSGKEETIAYFISDIRVYNRILTWQEIANMYYGRYRAANY